MMNIIRLKTLPAAAIAALFLAGCTVGPKYHTPTATVQPPPAAYKELPTQVSGLQKPGRLRNPRMRCSTANGGRFTTMQS